MPVLKALKSIINAKPHYYVNPLRICRFSKMCCVLQSKLEYMHGLYQHLLTGRVLPRPLDDINKFTWMELCVLINEQIAILINSLLREGEKVSTVIYDIYCDNLYRIGIGLSKFML